MLDDPYLLKERQGHINSLYGVIATIDFEFPGDEYCVWSAMKFLEKEQELARTIENKRNELFNNL